ncbi:MAG: glycosyltransferase [Verrucomicrobia bacterium]|nr:glycosyltransferase [Verrucomicrobiota bacterium]MCH8511989.1 glycosyltransferase [Kiritimatiellia bacterium]
MKTTDQEKNCIMTLGMHRGGTSAMSGILSILGVRLGRDLMLPHPENPKGYFENNRVTALNDQMLRAFDLQWDDPFPLPEKWSTSPKLQGLESELEVLLRQEFPDVPLIGMKDPRLSLLLPWWKMALNKFSVQPRYILMLRHPLEVTASLQRRDHFSTEKALLLWMSYMLTAERETRGLPRCVITYDALIREPIPTMRAGLNTLNIPLHDLLTERAEDVCEFISPNLRHHRATAAPMHPDHEIVEKTFEALRELSGSAPSSDQSEIYGRLDEIYDTFHQTRKLFLPADVNKAGTWARERTALQEEIVSLEFEILEKEKEIDAYQADIAALREECVTEPQKRKTQLFHDAFRGFVGHAQRWGRRIRNALRPKSDRGQFLCQLITGTLRHPLPVLRQFTPKRLMIVFRALTVDSPKAAMQDFEQYVPQASRRARTITEREIADARTQGERERDTALRAYLDNGDVITFARTNTPPLVSIIMVLYNRADWTLTALKALQKSTFSSYELILVDNASTDETGQLLDTIIGAVVMRNTENLHFLRANNQALPHIRGKFTLFLNNDTRMAPEAMERAVETLRQTPRAGAVGGKLLLSAHRLQEAGSIVWSDGSCLGYGRDDDPDRPEYHFARDVDFCSGAFLLTYTGLFQQHGGFDERYSPAYYEEVDYCFQLQQSGYRVLYDPRVVVLHAEFGGKPSDAAIELQKKNRTVFAEMQSGMLKSQLRYNRNMIPLARFSQETRKKKRILYIDDCVPHIDMGSGFPRANAIVNWMVKLGYNVTVYPMNMYNEPDWESAYRDIDIFIELMTGMGKLRLAEFMESRKNYYDVIWISRPHNMDAVKTCGKVMTAAPVTIYDAEAIFAQRDVLKKHVLDGDAMDLEQASSLIQKEIELAGDTRACVAVSQQDADEFRRHGIPSVHVLKHIVKTRPDSAGFSARKGLLFVGNLDLDDSPNVDSMVWFVSHVWPLVKMRIPDLTLDIIGSSGARRIRQLSSQEDVHVLGQVKDLAPYYANSRLFIAPTRYSAGVPIKIYESVAQGLPVVATRMLAEQLQWAPDCHLWVAPAEAEAFAEAVVSAYSNETSWQQVQASGLEAVERELSEDVFRSALEELLSIWPEPVR